MAVSFFPRSSPSFVLRDFAQLFFHFDYTIPGAGVNKLFLPLPVGHARRHLDRVSISVPGETFTIPFDPLHHGYGRAAAQGCIGG